jgi:hypothetical protein
MQLGVHVEIGDWNELFQFAEEVDKKCLTSGGQSLVELGEHIAEVIRERYVPVDVGQSGNERKKFEPRQIASNRRLRRGMKRAQGGTLRKSVELSEYQMVGNEASVTISAGGEGSGAEKYALVQHEATWYHHTVGQAKYIEIPVTVICAEKLEDTLEDAVNKVL